MATRKKYIPKLKLKAQMMLFIALILGITASIFFYISYQSAKDQVLDVGGEMFSDVCKDSVGLIDALNEQVNAGHLTLEEAQETAKNYILGPKKPDGTRDISKAKMSTNDYMYVWASHPDGTFVMHAFDLEGQNLMDYKVDGVATVRDSWANLDATGRVFRQLWQNSGEPVYTFIAYQIYYEPWDWIIGAGGREEIIYEQRLKGMQLRFLAVAFISFMIAMVCAYIFANRFSKKLKMVEVSANNIAAGDLSGEDLDIRSKDEIGSLAEAFNKMHKSFKDVVHKLQTSSQAVASSASELSASAESVTSTVSETASTIEEMASSVQQASININDIADTSTEAANLGRTGLSGVQDVRNQMENIQNVTLDNAQKIQELRESTEEITRIVELITQIADQTNLLALNAAIEAARAGEQGRGFAVVAEEVRKLAEQSTLAAKEIFNLIRQIQGKAEQAVGSMNQGKAEVENSARIVNDVGITFERIISIIQKIATDIHTVAAAGEQLTAATQSISAVTEEQTSTVDQVALTSTDLAGMAEELDTLANNFKL